ncbi:22775_t:CDS:2, partial [Entrophospora sp. SA101]
MLNPHCYREFFILINNPNNKTNARAVCKYCSEKNGGAQAAALIPGCYTTNKAILCHSHLSNCINFKNAFNNDEISEILSRPNKPKRQKNITNDTSTASSIIQKQPLISGYLRRPMSQKDIPYLENLILRMCVSNGLPFSFIENEDTKAFFNFLAPGIELPTRKKLAAKFNPDRVNVTRTNGIPNIPVDRRTTRNNKRRLPDDIVDSINDPVFWSKLFSLQNLLYPLCCFLNQLQKDAARLYEVVHCFAYTLHIFSMHHDLDFSEKMVSRIEKRWKGWEQPILLLSIILHPSYKLSKFRPTINNLSWTHVGQWLKYYYHAFCGKPATSILAELIDYRRGNDPYDYDSFLQFKGNVLNFWESTIGVGPELAKVAIHIHAVCVNSASVERLWSSMGYFILIGETDYQYHNKVLAMSQIRSDILYQQDLFVNENHETNDDDFLENNNESVNSNSDENVNQWNIIVAHWRDEASQENQLENHSDESLLEEDLDNDFLVGVNNIHPADNVNLKWELSLSCKQL